MSPRLATISLAGLLACKLTNSPYVGPVDLEVDLGSALAPSAAVTHFANSGPTRGTVSAWALDDGGAAAILSNVGLVTAAIRLTAGGDVHTVELGQPIAGTSLGDEAFIADCPFSGRFGLTDPAAGYVEYYAVYADPFLSYRSCGGALGVGATSNRVLQVDTEFVAVYLHELDRGAQTDAISTLVAAPPIPPGATVLLVYEPSEGQVRYVLVVDGDLVFLDEVGETVTATGIDGTLSGAWLGADGDVRIATSDALYRWDAAAEQAAVVDTVPAAPTGTDWVLGAWQGGAWAESGDPNPAASFVTIPTAMAVRSATDDGFDVFEPPLTPCCDRDACRALGESYLAGGIASSAGPLVVYDLWSWYGTDDSFTHVGVAAPDPAGCPGG